MFLCTHSDYKSNWDFKVNATRPWYTTLSDARQKIIIIRYSPVCQIPDATHMDTGNDWQKVLFQKTHCQQSTIRLTGHKMVRIIWEKQKLLAKGKAKIACHKKEDTISRNENK